MVNKEQDPEFERIMLELKWWEEKDQRERDADKNVLQVLMAQDQIAADRDAEKDFIDSLRKKEKSLAQIMKERAIDNNAYLHRSLRKEALQDVQKNGLELMNHINGALFGVGRISNWTRKSSDHVHGSVNGGGIKKRVHKYEYMALTLTLPDERTISLTIPLFEIGGKSGMSDKDFALNKIALGGTWCPEVVEASCEIPFSDRKWDNFREKVLSFVGEKFGTGNLG